MANKKIIYIFLHLVLIMAYYIYYDANPVVSREHLKVMGILGWVQISISIFSWKHITGKVFVPYVIFLISAYTFCFGQSFLDVFDMIAENRSIFSKFSESEVYSAQIYTLFFLSTFHIGAILAYKDTLKKIEIKDFFTEFQAVKSVGVILTFISFLPFVIEKYVQFTIVTIYGYGGLYYVDPEIPMYGVITFLADFFIPSILCVLLTSKPGSSTQRRIFVAFALFIYLIMYCGGRSQGVVLVAVVLLYYQNYVKPISRKGWFVICVFGVFFLSMLTAVAHLRGGSRENYIENIVNYESEEEANPAIETISEMGGSMKPLIMTQNIVPSVEDFRYGKSYFYSFTSIIPNLGFWKKHPAAIHGNLGNWLMEKYRLTAGPGYSLVAEAYINFGVFGFVAMLIMGFFFCKILNIDDRGKYKILSFLMAIIFTYMSLKMVRNSFIGTVRVLFYYMFPIYLYVTYQVKKQRK